MTASDYRSLSLTARLAVALRCFASYCDLKDLHHPSIGALLNDLWEVPVIDSQRWDDWENNHPPRVQTALGDDWPEHFEEFLVQHGTNPEQLRSLISAVVEIVFSSFYGAADDELAHRYVSKVLQIVGPLNVNPPPPSLFVESQFRDRGGWGRPISLAERDSWRFAEG